MIRNQIYYTKVKRKQEVQKQKGIAITLEVVVGLVLLAIIAAFIAMGIFSIIKNAHLNDMKGTVSSVSTTVEAKRIEKNKYISFGELSGTQSFDSIVSQVTSAGYDQEFASQMANWVTDREDNKIKVLLTATGVSKMAVVASMQEVPDTCVIYTSDFGGQESIPCSSADQFGTYQAAHDAIN